MAEPFVPFNRGGFSPGNQKPEAGGPKADNGSPKPAANTPSAAFRALTSAKPGAACGTPVVTLKKDGQKVTQIQIQCPCGQLIELDCVY